MDENKKKSLDTALKSIDKAFGKGMLMRLGDKPMQNIEAISTGSIGLDKALGIGGVPKGRIVEIYGPESSGKCFNKDNYLTSKHGILTVEELFEKFKSPLSSDEKTVLIPENNLLLNGQNDKENVEALTFNGVKKVYKVKTSHGLENKITKNHPLLVLKDDGTRVWTKQKKLKIGDKLIVSLLHSDDDYINSDELLFNKKLNKKAYKAGKNWIREDIPLKYRHNKEPLLVKSFILGIMDMFSVVEESSISVSFYSKKLLTELQLLFMKFGVFPYLVNDEVDTDKYTLIIKDDYLIEYGYHFNFKNKTKSEKLNEILLVLLSEKDGHSGDEVVVDEITDISYVGKEATYDVYMPKTSSFLLNNIVNHNTTIALQVCAEAQKKGGVVAFLDAEHALDPKYAKNLGVDVDNLLVSQPDYGEQALNILETLVQSSAVDVIVVDSVAALTPKSEIEGDMGDSQVGVQARMMSQALRKITGIAHKTQTTIIFINQIRMKIGMMGYGSPETTSGGNALKFYASVRLDIRRIQTIKQGEDSIANKVKVKVVKNKVAPPFKQTEFDIYFGEGISRTSEIIDYGVKFDIIDKAGTWFSYKDKKLGQGKEKSKAFLKENLDIAMEIEEGIKNAMGFDLPDLDDVETEDSE